jgi:hypothetical protein
MSQHTIIKTDREKLIESIINRMMTLYPDNYMTKVFRFKRDANMGSYNDYKLSMMDKDLKD